ncbi:MAG: type II secretion system F family protein, partial [Armatimonadota bacterium]
MSPLKKKEKKLSLSERFLKYQKVNPVSIAIFTRQFAILFMSGIPISKSLWILYEQTSDPKLKSILGEVYIDVCKHGYPLSAAFAKHPDAFPVHYTAMIKSGETGGKLEQILNRMANNQEKEVEFMKKIKAAMVYPVVIIIASLLAVIFMIKYIIPLFTPFFAQSKKALPVSTQIIIGFSKIMNNFLGIMIFLIVTALIIYLFRMYIKTKNGRLRFSIFVLNLPVLGKAVKMISIVRFCRIFSMLYGTGIPLLTNMEASKAVLNNAFLDIEMEKIIKKIPEAPSFTDVFHQSGIFPRTITSMIMAGEQSGTVSQSLAKISNFYDEEIENTLNTL